MLRRLYTFFESIFAPRWKMANNFMDRARTLSAFCLTIIPIINLDHKHGANSGM